MKTKIVEISLLCVCLLWVVGCSATSAKISDQPGSLAVRDMMPPDTPEVVTFYALGDWGTGEAEQRAVARALKADINHLGDRNVPPFVIGLGDNVYSHGLPRSGWNDTVAKRLLDKTFGCVYKGIKYDGEAIEFHIVPGNHDYAEAFRVDKNWGSIAHWEATAESEYDGSKSDAPRLKSYPINHDVTLNLLDKNDENEFNKLKMYEGQQNRKTFYHLTRPQKMDIEKLDDKRLTVISLDTQILLEMYRKEKQNQSEIDTHWKQLETLLETDGWKILVGHHPVETHGRHGGFRPWQEWVWTGTRGFIKPWPLRIPTFLWLPLLSTTADKYLVPVFKYPIFREIPFLKHLPSEQDTNGRANKKFRARLKEIMTPHQNTAVYLAGHDHSLQFLDLGERLGAGPFQLISGSAAKTSPVKEGADDLHFAHEAYGFARFDVTNDEMWIRFFAVKIKNEYESEHKKTATFRIPWR